MGFSRILFGLVILLAAGGACADTADLSPPDSRLDTKVTLEVNHTKLADALKQLTDETGVVFKAGSNKRDWRVRERRVTIHAKDIRLGTLMAEISGLLGYYLSRGGKEGEWTYLYWQDMKSRRLEEEMVVAEREAAAKRATETRQGALDDAEDALKLSPEEALKKKDKDPWLAYLGGTKAGRGYAQLLSSLSTNFPTARDLMLRGRRVTLSLSDIPSNMYQAAMDTIMGGILAAEISRRGVDLGDMVPYQLQIMPIGELQTGGGMMGIGGLIYVTGIKPGAEPAGGGGLFGGGMPMSMLPLSRSDSPGGKMFAKMLFAVDEGADIQEAVKQIQSEFEDSDFLADALGHKSPTEENPPTDPELTREVELGELPRSLVSAGFGRAPEHTGKAVAEISRAIGMPVLLESFSGSIPIGEFVKSGKQPVYKILIGLEKAGHVWALGDGTLRIRPENWALQRSYEIPESFLNYYKDLLEKQGEYTLDDLAAIAVALTDEQIQNTLTADPDLSFAVVATLANPFGGQREILRMYGSLSAPQKAALNGEGGLLFADLTDRQWEHLYTVITDRLGGVYILDGSVRLEPQSEAEVKAGMGTRQFEITVQAADETETRSFSASVMVFGKKQIEMIKEAQKKALEQVKKAGQEKEGEELEPAPAPTPTPKQ